jgi:MFS family permease
MAVGSALGALARALVATAPTLVVFTVGWLLAGLAMAATFYEPAFAALTRWYGAQRVRALVTLTLAGGMASTIFAPISASLTERVGWRDSALTLAVIILVTAAPLHAIALRGPRPLHPPDRGSERAAADPGSAKPSVPQSSPRTIIRSRPFVTLAAALTLSGFAMYAVVFGLIPLLTQRGATNTQAAGRPGVPVAAPFASPQSMGIVYRVWDLARREAFSDADYHPPLAKRPYDLRHAAVSL